MDLHQNARLTFRSRETLANQIMIEKVSRKTAAKWVHRYRTLARVARLAGSFLASPP